MKSIENQIIKDNLLCSVFFSTQIYINIKIKYKDTNLYINIEAKKKDEEENNINYYIKVFCQSVKHMISF